MRMRPWRSRGHSWTPEMRNRWNADIFAEDGLLRQLGLDLDPLRLGKGENVAVEIGEDEDAVLAFLQDFPVAWGNTDPALVIQEMKVATGEHLTLPLPT